MKILIQRVKNASVSVDGKLINKIDKGYLALIGIEKTDTIKQVEYLANKVINLRIFEDENGKMNKNIKQVDGKILAISQFTLCATTSSGNRPSFINAMEPELANNLYELFCNLIAKEIECKKGVFGANMQIELLNDRPVTIMLQKD